MSNQQTKKQQQGNNNKQTTTPPNKQPYTVMATKQLGKARGNLRGHDQQQDGWTGEGEVEGGQGRRGRWKGEGWSGNGGSDLATKVSGEDRLRTLGASPDPVANLVS